MAYRRYISTRRKQIYQQKLAPSFSNILHNHDDHDNKPSIPKYSSNYSKPLFSTYRASITTLNASNNLFTSPPRISGIGLVFSRNMSTNGIIRDSPAVNEVAVAAADSFFPVAGLQYLIDYVDTLTGLNWWASIVATTFLIRWLTLPLIINQLKATSKLSLIRPKLEEIKNETQDGPRLTRSATKTSFSQGMSAAATAEGQAKMQALFKEYKVTPFTPLKGLLIQGPVFICFFLAVKNMAEKVPSFHHGGAYWFLDLTTPDSMHILPVLTALTFWITVECYMQEGMEGNPAAKTIKNVSRGFAALTVPLTASFPKAIFCYWITSNVFSLIYGLVIRRPLVKKLFGIPIIPVTPAPADQHPGLSFDAIKKYVTAQVEAKKKLQMQIEPQPLPSESPAEASKLEKKKLSSSSVLDERHKSKLKE